MKNNYIRLSFWIASVALGCFACEDLADPIVENLEVSRAFSPTELTARIRNLTTIELAWKTRNDAASYVVEFSEDSLAFTNIVRTIEVAPNALPVRQVFDGQTRYSARVKAVSASGVEDSKWTAVTIMTELENIFSAVHDGDIGAVQAKLRWPAGSDVTSFKISPGNTDRAITAEEKATGVAVVTGLTGETDYTITLYKGTKQRGQIKFKTLIDIGNATAVHAADDLNAMIQAAASGAVLVLFPGDYTVNTGATIIINKPISLKGLYPTNKPMLHVAFQLEGAGAAIEVRDLDLDGDALINDVFKYNTAAVTFGALSIVGCNVHDYVRSLITANVNTAKVPSITIDNCVMTDIVTSGGDFIDFRNSHLTNLTITNSTFDMCSPGRDFIRLDNVAPANGLSGTGLTSTVLIDHCTIYGASNTASVGNRRLTYVRFNANSVTVKNTIIAESTGFYTNQTTTTQPACANNNYFNAPRFFDTTTEVVANLKVDNSGTHKTLNPGFTNAVGGNFTISNQVLKDAQVGDPRWRQ